MSSLPSSDSTPGDSTPDPGTPETRPGEGGAQPLRAPGLLLAGLHVVATPIGNLRDITLRALDTLSGCEEVLAEDTRQTRKLLDAYGLKAHLTPYHDHNGAQRRPAIIERLQAGAKIALVSDAGTPLVSDPGFKLVRDAAAAGVRIIPVPGASAPLAALVAAGLPSDRFMFAGFPPAKSHARLAFLRTLSTIDTTIILFESGPRLPASLADMAQALGATREGCVARELTKLFEEVRRASLGELASHYAEAGPPRGEIVVLIGPPPEASAPGEADIDAALRAALKLQGVKAAAAEVAERYGLPRRDLYQRALALQGEKDDAE